MPGKKTRKQWQRELNRRKAMLKKMRPVDFIRVGKSLDKGQKW